MATVYEAQCRWCRVGLGISPPLDSTREDTDWWEREATFRERIHIRRGDCRELTTKRTPRIK